jgi:hypothetical protein
MKNAVFWDVAPCKSCLQQPAHAGSSLADFSILKMKAIRSSETSVHTRSTRLHIPEDGILQYAVSAVEERGTVGGADLFHSLSKHKKIPVQKEERF